MFNNFKLKRLLFKKITQMNLEMICTTLKKDKN